ncbi:TetR/AcrR family transcriptional regulator [bacterium]|nr:MAG: TetR/AcrR family transcriptional regulator [bacterium]
MEKKYSLKEAGKEARREALMKAAGNLFAEIGYDGTTIESISQKAGMGKGSFYLHFESKERIFRALMEEAGDRIVERIYDISEREDNLTNKLTDIARVILSFHLRSDHPWFFILMEKGLERQKVMEHFYEKRKKVVDIIGEVLRQGMRDGFIVHDDPGKLSSLFLECVHGSVVRECCSVDTLEFESEAHWIVTRFLLGSGNRERG